MVYEDKGRFRSRVVLRVGEPIDPAPEAATYAKEGRVAVRKLTDRIAAGLDEATPRGMIWPPDTAPAPIRAARALLLPAAPSASSSTGCPTGCRDGSRAPSPGRPTSRRRTRS